MPAPDPFTLLLLLVSPAVGSFLGLLIDRLPRGEGVVVPPSRCRSCGTRLGVRDLVPVLSFLAARGRCRHCGAPIPGMALLSEIAAPGLALLAVLAWPDPWGSGCTAVVFWCLWALAVTDLTRFRLPDPLTAALFVAAAGLALLPGGDPVAALVGAALGAGGFFVIRLGYRALRGREGLGLGDVKLMAGLGAFLGPLALPLLVLLSALAALAFAALTPGGWRGTRPLPFGAALCLAAGLLWVLDRTGLALPV